MVEDIGLLATVRRTREAIAFRLARGRHLTDRGQFAEAIAMLERKVAARPRDVDIYFALGAAGTMFTRMIGHTAYFDTFAKRKILGLTPEKYVVLCDRANIGNAAYVDCWRLISTSSMIRQ